MAKIMLVEDDNNLREIYEARLLAEGYEIVAAKDGEEALALAVKERPDLIISDVMMPKISGFDMLDILRSTAETKDTKVIMMTALSQAEDKTRADKLGADRYLVKSQVTLEDVAKVARDVLAGDSGTPGAPGSAPVEATATQAPDPAPTEASVLEAPTAPAGDAVITPTSVSDPSAAPVTDDASTPVSSPVQPTMPVAEEESTAPEPVPSPTEPTEPDPEPVPAPDAISEPNINAPVTETASSDAQPTEDQGTPTDSGGIDTDLTQTTAQEEQAIENQINEIFAEPVTEEPGMLTTPAPGEAVEPAPPSMSPQSEAAEPAPVTTEQTVRSIEVAEAPSDTDDPVPENSFATPESVEPAPEVVAPISSEPPVETAQPAPAEEPLAAPTGGNRVIQPINDMSKGPNINDLLQKESENTPVPPAPATSVVSPGGQTVVPVTTDAPADTKQPGNVISPNDIAL